MWSDLLRHSLLAGKQSQRKIFTRNRLKKSILITIIGLILIVLGINIVNVIVRQRRFNSISANQTKKLTSPKLTPPTHEKSTNRSKICHLPTKIPIYSKTGAIIGTHSKLDQLNNTSDMFIDKKGNLYVADTGHRRIIKYVKDSNHVIIVAEGKDGNYSELNSPVALYIDEYETIYVLDNVNPNSDLESPYYRIFVYWPKLKNNQTIYESLLLLNGSIGKGFGLDLDSESNIYVAMSSDPYSTKSTHGTYGTGGIVKWLSPTYEFSMNFEGKKTLGPTEKNKNGITPKSIYIDDDDNIYFVSMEIFHVIGIYMTSYDIMKAFKNRTIINLAFFKSPFLMDIVIDCNQNMYIADGIDDIIKFYPSTTDRLKKGYPIINITSAYNQSLPNSVTYLAFDSQNGDIYIVNENMPYIQRFVIQDYIDSVTISTKSMTIQTTTKTTTKSIFNKIIETFQTFGR